MSGTDYSLVFIYTVGLHAFLNTNAHTQQRLKKKFKRENASMILCPEPVCGESVGLSLFSRSLLFSSPTIVQTPAHTGMV